MSQAYNSNRTPHHNPQDNLGAGIVVTIGLGVAVWFGSSGLTVFAASRTAGALLLVALAVCGMLSLAVLRKMGWRSLSFVLLVAAMVWALLGGTVVFNNHWLAFTPAAWVFNGLYVAALISGAWSTAQGWLKMLAGLFATSLIVATVVVPRPPGGEGPGDTAARWKVDVHVLDDHDQPLVNAKVLCASVLSWNRALELSGVEARSTDDEGRIATWEFDEDPRLKVIVANAWKNATEGNAEYPPETQFIVSPRGGGKYQLTFRLVENRHPDVAYLTVDPSGEFEQPWYALQFELWAGEPLREFGSRDGPAPSQQKPWQSLRHGGFTIPASEAHDDWQLRYFYEGPSGPGLGPPYSELRTIRVGSIEPGTRRTIRVTIPDR